MIRSEKAKLLALQKDQYPRCRLYFRDEDIWGTDHIIPLALDGKDDISNKWSIINITTMKKPLKTWRGLPSKSGRGPSQVTVHGGAVCFFRCTRGSGLVVAGAIPSPTILINAQGRYERIDILCEIATDLHNLAELYRVQGKYEQVEIVCIQARDIREYTVEPKHFHTVSSYNSLVLIFHKQGKYSQAESLYQQIVASFEDGSESEHLDLATSVVNLALLYEDWEKDEEATWFYQRALAIYKRTLGPEHL